MKRLIITLLMAVSVHAQYRVGELEVTKNVTFTTSNDHAIRFTRPTTGIGTVAITNGGSTVTGTGTKFTEWFTAGLDNIIVSGQSTKNISSIASDTSLTVTGTFSATGSGLTYTMAALTTNSYSVLPNGLFRMMHDRAGIWFREPTSGDANLSKLIVTTEDGVNRLVIRQNGIMSITPPDGTGAAISISRPNTGGTTTGLSVSTTPASGTMSEAAVVATTTFGPAAIFSSTDATPAYPTVLIREGVDHAADSMLLAFRTSAGAIPAKIDSEGDATFNSVSVSGGTAPLSITDSANQNTVLLVTNTSNGASASARLRATNDSGFQTTMSTHGSGNTDSRFGVTVGNYGELLTTSTLGLLIGTTTAASKIVFGTNSLARVEIGANGNVGIGTTASATAGVLVNALDSGNQGSSLNLQNTSAGTLASAGFKATNNSGTALIQSMFGSGSTTTLFGTPMASGAALWTGATKIAVGTAAQGILILGTNNAQREYMSGAPKALTESAATGIADISLANDTQCGGTLYYTIKANDASDRQALRGQVAFVAVADVAAITATAGTASEISNTSAGTLTNTFTITEADAGKFTLNLNAVSSLTQTSLTADFTIKMDGSSSTTCNATAL